AGRIDCSKGLKANLFHADLFICLWAKNRRKLKKIKKPLAIAVASGIICPVSRDADDMRA
ncbi:MAG: hypothetical protein IK033_04870, partial [Verrucomicrobia bacterium]|nr:hypothetical protein [Verrucomicrobiota bacterium]